MYASDNDSDISSELTKPRHSMSNDSHNFANDIHCLSVTAEELRNMANGSNILENEMNTNIKKENQANFSQITLYMNFICNMRIDARSTDTFKVRKGAREEIESSILTGSFAEDHDDYDTDTNTNENDKLVDVHYIERFLEKFIDNIVHNCMLEQSKAKEMKELIEDTVKERVNAIQAIPHIFDDIEKPIKVNEPYILPGEVIYRTSIRAYLLPDGRLEGSDVIVNRHRSNAIHSPVASDFNQEESGFVYLPADGAVFLTNYRLIFTGFPLNPYAREMVIYRSFPICSLVKEKRLTNVLVDDNITMAEGWQLRSFTFEVNSLIFIW